MVELLRAVAVMTIAGSVLALVLFAIKPLIRHHLPKTAQYYLWLVVLAALLLPMSWFVTLPQNPNILFFPGAVSGAVEWNVITAEEEKHRVLRAFNDINPEFRPTDQAGMDLMAKSQQSPISTAVSIFTLFYPIVSVAVLASYLISYWLYSLKLYRRRVPTDISARVRVYKCEDAATPMLIGVFSPVVILPDREYTDEQLQSVLLHELTHLRRKDVLVKWLSVFACAVHWFNPLVWLVRREIDRACELACDEAVIRNLDADGKQSYGDTLIAVAADSKMPRTVLSTTMCERKKSLKERLGAIMAFKKRGVAAAAISLVLIVGAVFTACVLGSGIVKGNSGNNTVYTPETAFAALSKYLPNVVTENLVFIHESTSEDDGILWLWYNANKETDGLTHKLEIVENDGIICRYRYKNYYLEIPENAIDYDTASRMVAEFAADFILEGGLVFENRPYENNIYDPNVVESWVAKSAVQKAEYVIMVNMAYGYIEQYTIEPAQPSRHELDYHITSDGLEIPNLFATPQNGSAVDKARFLQFGYSWTIDNGDGTGVSGVADSIAPWDGEYHPVNTLYVDDETMFDITCPAEFESISYRIYAEDGEVYDDGTRQPFSSLLTRLLHNNSNSGYVLLTPFDNGIYFYEIEARFAENDMRVNYAIRIIVKPDVYMTLDNVRDLSLGLGDDLTWEDLNGFIGMEVGSGLYIMLYDIEGGDYHLLVGSLKPDAPIEYAYFAHVDSEFAENKRIDIRYYDVDAFLAGEVKQIRETPPPMETASPKPTASEDKRRVVQAIADSISCDNNGNGEEYMLVTVRNNFNPQPASIAVIGSMNKRPQGAAETFEIPIAFIGDSVPQADGSLYAVNGYLMSGRGLESVVLAVTFQDGEILEYELYDEWQNVRADGAMSAFIDSAKLENGHLIFTFPVGYPREMWGCDFRILGWKPGGPLIDLGIDPNDDKQVGIPVTAPPKLELRVSLQGTKDRVVDLYALYNALMGE